MRRVRWLVLLLGLLVLNGLTRPAAPSALVLAGGIDQASGPTLQPGQSAVLTGRLEVLYGDTGTQTPGSQFARFFILDQANQQHITEVVFDKQSALPAGGAFAARGRTVAVRGVATSQLTARGPKVLVQALSLTSSASWATAGSSVGAIDLPTPTSGTTRWVNVRCKFAEQTTDPPYDADYFDTIMDHSFPHMGDYWHTVSYGAIDTGTSYTTTRWYQLTGNPGDYDGQAGHRDSFALLDECTQAAAGTEEVDFSQFYGVNLFFGEDLRGSDPNAVYFYGGQYVRSIGGAPAATHGVTWLGRTGYSYFSAHHEIAHEEGHGYGFAHSANDFWDPVSFGACATGAVVSGGVQAPPPYQWTHSRDVDSASSQCVEAGQLAYNKVMAGWMTSDCSTGTITLFALDLPRSSGCQVAKVPIGTAGTQFYTIEVRRCGSCAGSAGDGYDGNVAGTGVVIHVWDLSLFTNQDASVAFPCGHSDLTCSTNTLDPRDTLWTVGQTYANPANAIGITVLSTNAGSSFTVFVGPPPSVTSISPTSGPTGGPSQPTPMVTITGTHFTGATAVYFGGEQAQDNNGDIGPGVGFTVLSDTTIQAQPPWSYGGEQDHVQVITPGGYSATSAVDVFTYHETPTGTVDPNLAVTGVSPNTGPTGGGTTIQITGSGFRGYDGQHPVGFHMVDKFTWGDPRCNVVDDSHATCTTAVDDYAETVHIVAADTRGGWSSQTSADLFTYAGPARPTTPAVSGVTPFFGPTAGGNAVVVTGAGFINPVGDVQIGNANTAGPYTVNSDTQITATAPPPPAEYPGPPTVANVVITTDAVFTSALTAQGQYTFTDSAGIGPAVPIRPPASSAVPIITDISYHQGTSAGGDRLIIHGTGFTGTRSVRFGGVVASKFSVDSDSHITVTTPPHPVGMVTITVITGRESARRGVARFRFTP